MRKWEGEAGEEKVWGRGKGRHSAGLGSLTCWTSGARGIDVHPHLYPHNFLPTCPCGNPQVRAVAGGCVVSAGEDGALMIWEVADNRAMAAVDSSSGGLPAVVGLQLPSGDPLRPPLPPPRRFEAHPASIACLAVSADGKRIATGGDEV